MRVIGKEKHLTKLETFIEIKKELNNRKDIDKYLYNKINNSKRDGSKEYYEDILLKLNIDKILLRQVENYIRRTCKHLITEEMCSSSYNASLEKLNEVSEEVIRFFRDVKAYHIDNKEKIQIVDLDCPGFVDIYVILNYLDKKCDDETLEKILKLAHDTFRKDK